MMETCFEWMLVVSVDAKVESLFVSLPSVVSYTATGIMCQKESAAQCVKVQCLSNPVCLLISLLFFICFFNANEQTSALSCSSKVFRFLLNSVYFYIFSVSECAILFLAVLL